MTLSKRIQDMLPAMIVFFLVGVFGTYATVAFVVRDPWWMQRIAELRQEQEAAAPQPGGQAAQRGAAQRGATPPSDRG